MHPLLKLFTIWALVCLPVSAGAVTPWAEPGDAQLRRDIELLTAYGIVDGPITSWPIPWAQISDGLARMDERQYPGHVEAAIVRVRSHIPGAKDYRGFRGQIEVAGTNEPRLVRGFDGGARQEGEVGLALERIWSSTYIRAAVGWREGQVGNDIHFDNSFIAQGWGNWVFYAGMFDQWWGGGWDGGLLISTNARPIPRIGLQRLNPEPFETKWLSWLGNWNFLLSVGRLEKNRDDFAHPLLVQMRLTFSPIEGLDIGLGRAMQLCGKSRSCDFGTFADAIFPFNEAENTGGADEPGNQLAEIDIRYGDHVGRFHYALFFDMIAEDQNAPIVDKYSFDLGFSLGSYWERHDLDWTVRFEASDTQSDHLFGIQIKDIQIGTTYNHFIFTEGYRFRDRTIGHSLDTDSRLYTVEGNALDASGRSYWLRYRNAVVNATNIDQGRKQNVVSSNRESINLLEIGAEVPLRLGDLRLELRAMDDQPNTPGVSDAAAQFEASFRLRF